MSYTYENSRRRLAEMAKQADLAAIACVPGANFQYLSGLSFHLMERPTLMFVTADAQVLGILPELERLKWRQTFADAETFFWQDSDGFLDAFSKAAQALPTGLIGVEGMTMRGFEVRALETAFGKDRVHLADDTLAELRMQKSDSEIDALKKAIAVSEAALDQTLAEVQAGDTERRIAERLKIAMLQHGADDFAFDPLVLIGENAALPHGEPGDRQISAGDALLIDFGAQIDGLNADITRTFFFGHATDRQYAIYETVLAANARGRALAAPGVTADALDRATLAVLEGSGFADLVVHKTGHGLGRQVHEAPQIMIGNQQPLNADMVITIEPGLYAAGEFGIRIEDDVVIIPDGCTSLTQFPRDLQVIGRV